MPGGQQAATMAPKHPQPSLKTPQKRERIPGLKKDGTVLYHFPCFLTGVGTSPSEF